MSTQTSKEYNQYFLRHFVSQLLIIFILLTLFFIIGLDLLVKQRKNDIKSEQQRKVLSEQNYLEYALKEAVYDLKVMTDNQSFKDFLSGRTKDEKVKKYLEGLISDLFIQKSNYFQFRFINTRGMEVFRMDRINGEPVVTPAEKLQDKSKRYYFQEAMKEKQGCVYISPFDLNIEHEKIEKPFRPMIRICIPVFDGTKRIGINVLNYDGTDLLDKLKQKTNRELGLSYLVNKEGYFLNAPDTSIEWGFMFPDKADNTIKKEFAADFQQLEEITDGQFESSNGIYTVATVYPFGDLVPATGKCFQNDSYSWKVISLISNDRLKIKAFIPLDTFLLFYAAALLSGLIFAYFYSKNALSKYQSQKQLAESEKNLRIANQTKDQFFSILSHDLKNASGSISSYLELICDNFDSFSQEEIKMHLESVMNAAKLHTRLLYEVLDWARLQQGAVKFEPKALDLEKLFLEQKEQVKLVLENKELFLDLDMDPGIQVFGDKEMIKTILRNLINNAIKFSYRQNKIILSAKSKAERIEIRVTDFGVGMNEDQKEKLFDLNSKVHRQGTEDEEGSGFGLKLVLELIKKNNGSLLVESEPGKGTCFIVILPSMGIK